MQEASDPVDTRSRAISPKVSLPPMGQDRPVGRLDKLLSFGSRARKSYELCLAIMRRPGLALILFRNSRRLGFRSAAALAWLSISELPNGEERLFNSDGALVSAPPPLTAKALALPFGYTPTQIAPGRIAAIVHIFYEDLAAEIVKYLRNVPWKMDIFISTDTHEKRELILAILRNWHNGTVEVRVMPNRGRDIAPKLIGFKDIYSRYEYVLHLHSKKSLYSNTNPLWREYLYRSLLDTPESVRSLFEAFHRNPRLGFIAPMNWEPIKHQMNWGYDFPIACELAERMGIDLARDQPLDFPSGSMFWARTAALVPLTQLDLSFDDFPQEDGQIDGTIAHAIERLFFRICEKSGHSWLQVAIPELIINRQALVSVSSSNDLDTILREPVMLSDPALRESAVIEARRTNTNYRPIRFLPDTDDRPRLTLLLPTYHPGSVFGGIATALNLFERIANKSSVSEIERRIVITSDERPIRRSDVPTGYDLVTSPSAILPRRAMIFCPPTARLQVGLTMRRNDVLFASAWWDAANAFSLIDQTRSFFGSATKLGYFIQDFEPNFSSWSTSWALANETYKRPSEMIAIINSKSLATFLEAEGYHFSDREIFQPIWNNALKAPEATEINNQKKNIVLVYWRPSVQRNLAELALAGLGRWLEADPIGTRNWEIWGVGENGPDVSICRGRILQNLGKLSMEEYERVLRQTRIGLSLMLSPHPSYPPLEMAAYGAIVVTNTYLTKELSQYGQGFECVEKITPASLGAALHRAASRWKSSEYPKIGLNPVLSFASDTDLDELAARVAKRLLSN